MNILYISIFPITSLWQRDVYADISREMHRRGHRVVTVSPLERRQKGKTALHEEDGAAFLRVRTLNNQKVGAVEKMLALLTTPWLLWRGIEKRLQGQRFDLILYDTPFVRLAGPVKRLKQKHNAKTYLLLKDIWPQTLCDLGSMRQGSPLYRLFDKNISQLYAVSDFIGCPSQGSVDFLRKHCPWLDAGKLDIVPHCIEAIETVRAGERERRETRSKHGISDDAVLFTYGGNFGKPQGVEFIMRSLESFQDDARVFFLLIGAGTEYMRLQAWLGGLGAGNIRLLAHMPKDDYLLLMRCADVGMVFLNPCFTVPNIPSRTLDYLQHSLPVIAAVDAHTDYRDIIEQNGFGLGSVSGDLDAFRSNVEQLLDAAMRQRMGDAGRRFFEENWTAEKACDVILRHFT